MVIEERFATKTVNEVVSESRDKLMMRDTHEEFDLSFGSAVKLERQLLDGVLDTRLKESEAKAAAS